MTLKDVLKGTNYKIECIKTVSAMNIYYKNSKRPVPGKTYTTRYILTDTVIKDTIFSIEKEFLMNLKDISKNQKSWCLFITHYGSVRPQTNFTIPEIFKQTSNLYLEQENKPTQKHVPVQNMKESMDLSNVYERISTAIKDNKIYHATKTR